MKKSLLRVALLSMICLTVALLHGQSGATPSDDPFLWLEEPRALAWAQAENERTLGSLQSDLRYDRFYRDDPPGKRPDSVRFADTSSSRNFWQDASHVRGIWRRTTFESYRGQDPRWETILDIDALALAENKNWVYKDRSCFGRRCLVRLSDGGKDAVSIREFDTEAKSFVAGRFQLPEGKQSVSWIDRDTVLVARDWGEGTTTEAGYPFVLKELKRAQPLDQAREVFRGQRTDFKIVPLVFGERRIDVTGVERRINGFERQYVLFGPAGPIELDLPTKASIVGIASGRLLVKLDEDWIRSGDTSFKAGSMISYDLAEWKQDPLRAKPSVVFQPNSRQALRGFGSTRNFLVLTILDNVQSKAFVYRYDQSAWHATPVPLPENATVSLSATSAQADEMTFTVSDYLTPTSIWYFDAESKRLELLKTAPATFDASKHVVEQLEATSRDGTRIPYFLVRPRSARFDGSTPTLLYGYGGFQLPLLPSYAGPMGRLWLEQGNAYVVANLRGGGEFGPAWHRAGQGATKQSTWDDFIAVADDLIRRKLTSPRRLGVIGGSQGGLLVGTAMTQRPELFNAAIIRVPLFDMLRFTQLGAGASWTAEYGDPAIPEQREWIEDYSPYQKAGSGQGLPGAFHFHLHQRRSRASCPRPQGCREARCTGPDLFLL
ncbi:prolyl oligopeptidase family serine peptidase [Bradyrhizobium ottawaense]|uniref:prolyl oligopeptidase family serine peptidase n=1 Tax=Bradyrhizobium ottawaense TaxID=931866 RepID=UPI003F9FF523